MVEKEQKPRKRDIVKEFIFKVKQETFSFIALVISLGVLTSNYLADAPLVPVHIAYTAADGTTTQMPGTSPMFIIFSLLLCIIIAICVYRIWGKK